MIPPPDLRSGRGDRALAFGFYALGTLMVALAVHLASVLAIPRRADRDAYARVAALVGQQLLHTIVAAPAQVATTFPDSDPAVATAFCLFDLEKAPAHVEIDVRDTGFVALSLHGRHGRTRYGLTNRSASGGRIALVLMTPKQAEEAAAREGDDAPAGDLSVALPEPQGFVEVQVLAAAPSAVAEARTIAGRLSCTPAASR